MTSSKLPNGTPVRVNVPNHGVVSGKIVGVSNTSETVIGIGYIVQADNESEFGDKYPYQCFTAFESMFVTDEPFRQYE